MKSKSRNKRRPTAAERAVVRARTRLEHESEPTFKSDSEVVQWGGELYWAVDLTSGGAPIGLQLSEIREMEVQESDLGWARAKRVLDRVFYDVGKVDIGRVVKVGQGLSYHVFAAKVELEDDPDGLSGDYAVLLPLGTYVNQEARVASRARVLRERTICRHVAARMSRIRVPEFRAMISMPEGDALVRRFLRGMPLDLRAGRQHGVTPWEIVTRVAAEIHAIDVGPIAQRGDFPTRRAHALSNSSNWRAFPNLSTFTIGRSIIYLPRNLPF